MIRVGKLEGSHLGILVTDHPVYNYPDPDPIIKDILARDFVSPCAGITQISTRNVYLTENFDEEFMTLPDVWCTVTEKEFNWVSFDIRNIETVDVSKIDIMIYDMHDDEPKITWRQNPLPAEGLDYVIKPEKRLCFDASLHNIFNHSIFMHDNAYVTFFEYSFNE